MGSTIVTILAIVILHYGVINGLEKMLFESFFQSSWLSRPSTCENNRNRPVKFLGMPSGHVEIVTILSLWFYRFLKLPLVVCIIAFTCIQRVVSRRHTVLQTGVGILFGLFYAWVYSSVQYPLVLSLFFVFLYGNILMAHLDYKVKEKTPDWVHPSMYGSIQRKKQVRYDIKLVTSIFPSFEPDRFLFLSWRDLEFYLDQIVDHLKKTGIRYDAVVGIKTGGAILSGYISQKLGIPQYPIKVSNAIYQCKKTPGDIYQNYLDLYIRKKQPTYMLCEGIDVSLEGKNIVLIDEMVASGSTMNYSIDYLLQKGAAHISPVTIISTLESKAHPLIPLYSTFIQNGTASCWPWGYDN
jgi:hypoxanthine phosphoribosyltransferase